MMKTSEMVLNFLRQQGFIPEVDEGGNIDFKYQMASFVFINNDEDEEFFQLMMPCIFDVTDDNCDMVMEAANKVNRQIKVVKACVINDSVWLLFESLLDHSPEVSDIIPRALNILQGARRQFYEEMS